MKTNIQKRKVAVTLDTTQLQLALDNAAKFNTRLEKYWDFNLYGVSVGTTPQYFPLLQPVSGTAQGQRVSNQLRITRAEYRVAFTQVNSDLYSTARMTFLIWKPYDSSDAPTGDDLYATTAHVDVSPFTWESRHRYTVLKDFTIPLVGSTTSLTTHSLVTMQGMINLGNREVMFNPGLLTGSGLPYVALTSNSAAPPFPTLDIYVRVFYNDA